MDAVISPLVSSWQELAPGAVQGTVTVMLGHPLDTLKTRLQAPRSAEFRTPSLYRTASLMVRTEGVRSLYRGVAPPLLMTGGKRSLQFALFHRLRASSSPSDSSSSLSLPLRQEGSSIPTSTDSAPHNGMSSTYFWQWMKDAVISPLASNRFVSGAIAGASGTIVGCPAHVIKIRTQNATREELRNAWSCVVHIAKEEGAVGFYRGWRAHLVKDAMFAGMYLGLYDLLRQYDNESWKRRGAESSDLGGETSTKSIAAYRTFRVFCCGATASVLTWTILFPLDTVKTVIQAKRGVTVQDVVAVVGGYGALYHGLRAALLKSGPVSGVAMISYEWTKSALA